MFLFLLFATINLALIFYILRKRGMATIEGVAMLYLSLAIVSDHVVLLWKYMFFPDELRQGYGEFSLRVFPTAIHIIGLLALYVGHVVLDPADGEAEGLAQLG